MNHPSDVDLSLGDPGWMRAGAGVRGQGSVSVTAFGVHGGFSLTPSPLPGEMPHSMGFTEMIMHLTQSPVKGSSGSAVTGQRKS